MNFRIEIDAAAFKMYNTTDPVDGESVFATFGEAKEAALAQAVPERDAWASCVREIRSYTTDQITTW